jgi:hypothetical protein
MCVISPLASHYSLTSRPIQTETEDCQACTKVTNVFSDQCRKSYDPDVVVDYDVVHVLCVAGYVHVYLKDSIFQASSPSRHTTELRMLIISMFPSATAMIVFTYGGPDYNCKYTSVRLGILALFLELDLDIVVVMRKSPTQRWANPIERVMSVLNLGLQGVALARQEMAEEYENEFKKCNGMSAIRNTAQEYAHLAEPQVATEHVGISIVA